jgi:WD40 repeat protein
MAAPNSLSEPEQRFESVVADYLEAADAGRAGDWRALLQQHPDLADELTAFFKGEEDMAGLAAPLRQVLSASSPVAAGARLNLKPGAELGDFEIRRELGRGGMGVVYEAEQRTLGRRVALKILPWDATLDERSLQRFRQEAHAAAQLHHPHIVPVHEVGSALGLHYYAMQLIEGHSLAEWLKAGRGEPSSAGQTPTQVSLSDTPIPGLASARSVQSLDCRALARLALQAADALEHAHQQGVLHRDIKPANLLVDNVGDLWITDFGLAKAQGASELTRTGDLVGTLRFMAPERFRGWCDPRSDVYSLGLTLHELLTREPAFANQPQERLIQKILHEDPPRPRKLNPAIPPDLETIVLKASAKEPVQRYRSAAELAEDLGLFLAGRPIKARRVTALGKTWRWCRRNPAAALMLGSIALLLVVIAVGASVNAHLLGSARDDLAKKHDAAQENLRGAYLAQAQARRLGGLPGRRFASLDALAKAAAIRPGPDLRDEALATLIETDARVAQTWPAHAPRPQGNAVVNFDRQLGRYVETDEQGRIFIRQVADQSLILELQGADVDGQTWFSPDGRHVVVHYPLRLKFQVWDLESRARILEAWAPREVLNHGLHEFSSDGGRLFLALDHQKVGIYDLMTKGEEKFLQAAHAAPINMGLLSIPSNLNLRGSPIGPRFPATKDPKNDLKQRLRAQSLRLALHPDGQKVAVAAGGSKTVEIFDVPSGKVVRELAHPDPLISIAWHPGGELLAAAISGSESQVFLWDVNWRGNSNWIPDEVQVHRIFRSADHSITQIAFNHAGDRLASTGSDGTTQLWDVGRGMLLVAMRGQFRRFSADDRRLGFVHDNEIGVWELDGGRECRVFHALGEKGAGPYSVDADPRGHWLATTHDDGARLWDIAQGKEAARLPVGMCRAALFTGDGLVTHSGLGVQRWPIRHDREHKIDLGPPKSLGDSFTPGAPFTFGSVSGGVDGSFASLRGLDEAVVIRLNDPATEVRFKKHDQIGFVGLSRSGEWLVTASKKGSGIKCWDAKTGRLVKDIDAGGDGWGVFSPDSRFLVTSSRGHAAQIWDMATWQSRPLEKSFRCAAFNPDGAALALAREDGLVELLEFKSGASLGLLTSSRLLPISSLRFTPDGGRLAACCPSHHLVQVWDLRALGRGLAVLRLGADWPLAGLPSR